MANNKEGVDWSFIGEMEGGAKRTGYIPTEGGKAIGKSGLTLATGWDVGQMSMEELESSGLPQSIVDKVSPFIGAKGEEALGVFEKLGAPSISKQEASLIDKYTHGKALSQISKKYGEATGKSFEDLTSAQQTVMASVGFQYGSNLKDATPGFWKQATTGDWTGALKNLQNFGDRYDYRRGREAEILGADIAMRGMNKYE